MTPGRLGARFWRLWSATSATNLGDGLSLTAFPLLAVQSTDDARLVAAVTVARSVPYLLVGLPIGVLVDRYDRRVLVIAAQAGRAVVMAVVATAVAVGAGSILLLIAAALVVGAGEIVVDSSIPAMIRSVVATGQLEVANARQAAAQTVTNFFIGPPLGAALFAADPAAPFAAVVVMFTVGIGLMTTVPGSFRPAVTDEATGLRERVSAGLRYVWRHPVLRPLALTVMAFAFVGEGINAVYVILVTEHLGLGDVAFGLLLALDAVVSVAVSFLVAPLVSRVGYAGSMKFSVIAFGVSALLLGASTALPLVLVAVVLGGASDPTWNVVSQTIRQRLVPDEVFGRVMTAYLFVAWGAQPAGALLGGVVAEAYGADVVFLCAVPVMVAILVAARPMFRAVRTAMSPT